MGCTDEYGAEREVADPHLCQEGCGTVLANPDLWPPVCEECWEKESRRDEENRRLSISADLERRAEDE